MEHLVSLAWPLVVLSLGALYIVKSGAKPDDRVKELEEKVARLSDDVSKLNLAISIK